MRYYYRSQWNWNQPLLTPETLRTAGGDKTSTQPVLESPVFSPMEEAGSKSLSSSFLPFLSSLPPYQWWRRECWLNVTSIAMVVSHLPVPTKNSRAWLALWCTSKRLPRKCFWEAPHFGRMGRVGRWTFTKHLPCAKTTLAPLQRCLLFIFTTGRSHFPPLVDEETDI